MTFMSMTFFFLFQNMVKALVMPQPSDPLRFIARYLKCRRHVDVPKILLVHLLPITGWIQVYTESEILSYGLRSLLQSPPPAHTRVSRSRGYMQRRYILWSAILCKYWLPYSMILFRQSERFSQHSQKHRSGNHRSAERIA